MSKRRKYLRQRKRREAKAANADPRRGWLGRDCIECGRFVGVKGGLAVRYGFSGWLHGRFGDPFVCPDCVERLYGWEVRRQVMSETGIVGDFASLEAANRTYREVIDEAEAKGLGVSPSRRSR